MRAWHCYPFPNWGIAMTISTAAFGVYFYIVSSYHSGHATEAQPDLSWLPLASMAIFIAGIWIQTHCLSSVSYDWIYTLKATHLYNAKLVPVFRFCSRLGSNSLAGHVRNFPCQSQRVCQCCMCTYQLGHGIFCDQNLPGYDGECFWLRWTTTLSRNYD